MFFLRRFSRGNSWRNDVCRRWKFVGTSPFHVVISTCDRCCSPEDRNSRRLIWLKKQRTSLSKALLSFPISFRQTFYPAPFRLQFAPVEKMVVVFRGTETTKEWVETASFLTEPLDGEPLFSGLARLLNHKVSHVLYPPDV